MKLIDRDQYLDKLINVMGTPDIKVITNQDTKEYIIRANQDEEGNWYLVVKFFDLMEDGPDIIIQDGEWNFA